MINLNLRKKCIFIVGDKMAINHISKFIDKDVAYNHVAIEKPDGKDFEPHTHAICEIIYLVRGDVSAVIGGKAYKLYKNSLTVFRPESMHSIIIDSEATYERYSIFFDEKVVANKIFEAVSSDIDVINCSGNNLIIDLLKKMDYYCVQFNGENLKKLIYALVEELVYNLSIVSAKVKNNLRFSVNPLINQAIEYVEKNYMNNITLQEISNALFISKRHLHHLFGEKLQTTPKKYVNSVRLARAQNLIRAGVNPTNVFSMCGFMDYATFHRNYKKYFGHTPSEEITAEIDGKIRN